MEENGAEHAALDEIVALGGANELIDEGEQAVDGPVEQDRVLEQENWNVEK